MRAEITIGPESKHKMATFLMRMAVTKPKTDVVLEADSGRCRMTCGDNFIDFEIDNERLRR